MSQQLTGFSSNLSYLLSLMTWGWWSLHSCLNTMPPDPTHNIYKTSLQINHPQIILIWVKYLFPVRALKKEWVKEEKKND